MSAPTLPAWGVAWTDVGGEPPNRLRCHGCHLCLYYDAGDAGQTRAARDAMLMHAAECRQIDTLVVRLKGGWWTVDHFGPVRARVARAFGGETKLRTPYGAAISGPDVVAMLRRRNKGAVVMLAGGDEEPLSDVEYADTHGCDVIEE